MEEKKMQELNLDEMDKISGGGDSQWERDENGRYFLAGEQCSCGGRWYLVHVSGGSSVCKCNGCGAWVYGGA